MEFTVIPKNDLAELFSPEEIADFDVPAGTTKEMEITVSVSSQLVQAKNAKLWVSLNSASYIGSSIFMVAPDQ